MPCPHFKIKISSRSKSPPATAQAAYQSGERLYDERTHRTKSYTEKRGIVYTEIMLPDNAPREYADRNTLWNAVEKAEYNWNAQTARRLEIALPIELPLEKSIEMICEYCQDQFVSKGMIADIAIHDPDPPNHNPHAHVMLTMRAMNEHGQWLPKCHREYVLDEEGNRIADSTGKWIFNKVFTTDWDDHANAEKWRKAWETIQNRYLEEADRTERISMKSYERQGIDQIPTVHMGPAVTAMELRGIKTNIGNLNREIKSLNALISTVKRALGKVKDWISNLKKAIQEIEIEPKEVPFVDLLIRRYNERTREYNKHPSSNHTKWTPSQQDYLRFCEVIDYVKASRIRSIADLDNRLRDISFDESPFREQIHSVNSRINKVERLLENGNRMEELDPIHDQYMRIHWKGRKEKYAAEHKEELNAWNRADRYIRKNLPDQPFNADTLKNELSSLSSQLTSLNESLMPYQKETKLLQDIRWFVKELAPELEPQHEHSAPENKEHKQKSIREQIAEIKKELAAKDVKNQQDNYPKIEGIDWER